MIDCIMATDMAKHDQYLQAWADVRLQFDNTNPEHRLLLAQIIIKAADLSNTTHEFHDSEAMSIKLLIESQRQGRMEIALGLPISPMCNPNDQTPLCVGQVGFYAFVAAPLMRQILAFAPEFEDNVKKVDANLERWQAMKSAWESDQFHAME
jgi:hypothetical protein